MSISVTLLAFDDKEIVNNSKIAVIADLVISGLLGYGWLKKTIKDG